MNKPKLLEMQAEAKRQLKEAWQAAARAESEEEIQKLNEIIKGISAQISELEKELNLWKTEAGSLERENERITQELADCRGFNEALQQNLAELQKRFDKINVVIEFWTKNQDEIEFIISMRELARGTANVSIQVSGEEKLHFAIDGKVCFNADDDKTLIDGAETLQIIPSNLEIAVQILKGDSDFTVEVEIER